MSQNVLFLSLLLETEEHFTFVRSLTVFFAQIKHNNLHKKKANSGVKHLISFL